jgi:putative FmdB family regulatory protein
MPLYEYVCKKCGRKFSEVLSIRDHDTKKIECPACKGTELEKVIEPFFAKTTSKTGSW